MCLVWTSISFCTGLRYFLACFNCLVKLSEAKDDNSQGFFLSLQYFLRWGKSIKIKSCLEMSVKTGVTWILTTTWNASAEALGLAHSRPLISMVTGAGSKREALTSDLFRQPEIPEKPSAPLLLGCTLSFWASHRKGGGGVLQGWLN